MNLYLLLESGTYEYLPLSHKLKLITKKNLKGDSGTAAGNPFGVIVIAMDENKTHDKSVAMMSAGSSAQSMYIMGAAYDIQMLTQVSIPTGKITKILKLPGNIKPLSVISFGHANK